MEGQNRRAMMREDAGIVELELCQLKEIEGGICEGVIVKDGHRVTFPNYPERWAVAKWNKQQGCGSTRHPWPSTRGGSRKTTCQV
jgi:hypothetical protein